MEKQSVSRQLASFMYSLSFRQLPNDVIDRAKHLILDALSVLVAGHDTLPVKIGVELVKNNKGNAPVLTYDFRVPILDATFINALLITSTGQDDFSYTAHPGAVVIPATLTVGDQEGSSGAEAITAVVAGYEVMGRIFLAAPSILPKFRSTSVIGPLGAAVAAGKMLKLNEDQLVNALGYAANFSSGFGECFATGFMERKFNDAMASRNGVTAVLLAKEGAKASEMTLEGKAGFYQAFAGIIKGLDAATIDLGKRFLIMDATYKPYPLCGYLQTTVDAVLSFAKQHDIRGEDIDKVVQIEPEEVPFPLGHNYTGPFTSRIQAVVSAQFLTASALLDKPVASHTFFDNYNDPEVVELTKKIELVGEKGRDSTTVEVTLRDGRQYSIQSSGVEVIVPTANRIMAKFDHIASAVLGKEKAGKISNIVSNLDTVNNIRQLTKELGQIT